MHNPIAEVNSAIRDSLVMFHNSQGLEMRASLLRITPYEAVFEIYNPALVLRLSEVLADFRVIINDRAAYSGRAVVSNLVNTGTLIVCETKLEDSGLILSPFSSWNGEVQLRAGFRDFLGQWQKIYKVQPEFKVVVADMHTFLMDLC